MLFVRILRRQAIPALCGLSLLPLAPCAAAPANAAGKYPARPVTLVVGYAAGGSTDKLARLLARYMEDDLGQPVVVESRPGAAGNVGALAVAQAMPDGYALFMATVSSHAINPSLRPKATSGFDALASFEHVALVARYPLLVATTPASGMKTPEQMLAFLRAHPDKAFFSSAGAGSAGHLSGELIRLMAKVPLTHVPYKGGGPAMVGAMSGEVSLIIDPIPAMVPVVKSGRLVAIAVTSARRSPALPGVPSLGERAVPGFDVSSWAGIVAPAKTPRDVIDRLEASVAHALADPRLRAALVADGAQPSYLPGNGFRAFNEAERRRWGEVIRRAEVRLD